MFSQLFPFPSVTEKPPKKNLRCGKLLDYFRSLERSIGYEVTEHKPHNRMCLQRGHRTKSLLWRISSGHLRPIPTSGGLLHAVFATFYIFLMFFMSLAELFCHLSPGQLL
jgi:hypothetical protein